MEIEKNVPITKLSTSYTPIMRNLEIGDSFVVPKKDRAKLGGLANNLKIKITTRKTEDGKVRVWRIA